MALMGRFTLRPDQRATIEETRKAKAAAIPVEETLAIEVMVPESSEEQVSEPVAQEEQTVPKIETESVKEETDKKEPVPEKIVEEIVPEKPAEETAVPAEAGQETEEPKKVKRTRRTTKKSEPAADQPADDPEIINVTNALKKDQELQDAIASVIPDYVDTAFNEFKEQMEKDLLLTAFDEQADTGVIRVILSNLGRCYDNATSEYAKVNTYLEQLTNKTYGLITRQIILNSNGINEVARKQNGVHAPEVYTAPDGKTMNLYALQAALEAEAIYLQAVLKKLEYKRSTLIAFLTANKLEAHLTGD